MPSGRANTSFAKNPSPGISDGRRTKRRSGAKCRNRKVLFWVHQVLFGFKPIFEGYLYIFLGSDLMVTNSEYFTWIGGSLMWGLAALIHPVRTDRQAGA